MIPTKEDIIHSLELRHGKELQRKFSSATVAVCGLGGLGSNIAISLARSGIGKLILIDFDKVDISNINRQQYKISQIGKYKTDALSENIKEIMPYTEIETYTARIESNNIKELLKNADIICEAFDNPECKAMLVNAVPEFFPKKYLIAASGMAGMGSVNAIKTRRITKHFYLCGDGSSEINDTTGLFAPRVMLCAAQQAHTVLRILADIFEV